MNFITFDELNKKNIINFFTYKPYNFRSGYVSDDEINKNLNKLQKELNFKFEKFIKPVQNHTNIVKIVNKDNLNDSFENVDGLITNLKNVAIATSLADCQGILIYDDNKKVIGNVHSGWKGTLNRIIENAIKLMINEFESDPSDIEIFICPSILKCCFEVSEDLAIKFKDEFSDIVTGDIITKANNNKYFIDTTLINKRVLINLGIRDENIHISNICSKCNSKFIHSHRADGINAGRNIACIMLV